MRERFLSSKQSTVSCSDFQNFPASWIVGRSKRCRKTKRKSCLCHYLSSCFFPIITEFSEPMSSVEQQEPKIKVDFTSEKIGQNSPVNIFWLVERSIDWLIDWLNDFFILIDWLVDQLIVCLVNIFFYFCVLFHVFSRVGENFGQETLTLRRDPMGNDLIASNNSARWSTGPPGGSFMDDDFPSRFTEDAIFTGFKPPPSDPSTPTRNFSFIDGTGGGGGGGGAGGAGVDSATSTLTIRRSAGGSMAAFVVTFTWWYGVGVPFFQLFTILSMKSPDSFCVCPWAKLGMNCETGRIFIPVWARVTTSRKESVVLTSPPIFPVALDDFPFSGFPWRFWPYSITNLELEPLFVVETTGITGAPVPLSVGGATVTAESSRFRGTSTKTPFGRYRATMAFCDGPESTFRVGDENVRWSGALTADFTAPELGRVTISGWLISAFTFSTAAFVLLSSCVGGRAICEFTVDLDRLKSKRFDDSATQESRCWIFGRVCRKTSARLATSTGAVLGLSSAGWTGVVWKGKILVTTGTFLVAEGGAWAMFVTGSVDFFGDSVS